MQTSLTQCILRKYETISISGFKTIYRVLVFRRSQSDVTAPMAHIIVPQQIWLASLSSSMQAFCRDFPSIQPPSFS